MGNSVVNYNEQGGARQVIGGSLDVISGGDLDIESGASLKIAGTAITPSAAELNILKGVTATAAELNTLDKTGKVNVQASGTLTLTAADHGNIYIATAAAGVVFTLPPTVAGLSFTFITGALSSGTGLSLSPDSADSMNGGSDNVDLINTEATDVLGDCVTIVGDGTAGWWISSARGIWA